MTNLAYKIDETKSMYGYENEPVRQQFFDKVILTRYQLTATTDSAILFKKLADQWQRETSHLSFVSQRMRHPAYNRIINMGRSMVPLIIKQLEQEPDHWFYALASLTGENPIPADFTGTVNDAADLWIQWGRSRYAA
ncbi:MAG: hypothetical protein ACUZ8O_02610 [Candidatus Anammoxibacter sp.]